MSGNEVQFSAFEEKMRRAGAGDAAVRAFRHSYTSLLAGNTGLIPESEIQPVEQLPALDEISAQQEFGPDLLAQTVVVKLNGGLGTSMGLERAKSLLQVKNGLTFLDFIARHVLHLRQAHHVPLRFVLMNSFSTSADTIEFLRRYPELGEPGSLELFQNQVPKVDARSLRPVSWPENPQLEWCPPGHGDLYPSLLGSGLLERLLANGVKYLFVSNADNLGATLDLRLLGYFAGSGKALLMEAAQRTASDRKGGHLALRGGKLLLRESAQCPEADQSSFQDIQRHRFFNSNNLWIRLDFLSEYLRAKGGFVPLPLIKNAKTVDPRDQQSTPVLQLETAMGAAIECFENTGAILVPRHRFSPVKTTADLLALRSDAYEATEDWRLVLAKDANGEPPRVELDAKHYRLVDQLDASLVDGVPSLKGCRQLTVQGPVRFNAGTVFKGKVTISNSGPEARKLTAAEYVDTVVRL